MLEISCFPGDPSGLASGVEDCTMAPKVQENGGAGRRKQRVFPRVSPRKARVSAYAREFIPIMMQQDWISRHIYHCLLSQRSPWLGEEIKHCMTSDELLTGKANASKSLVQVIHSRTRTSEFRERKTPSLERVRLHVQPLIILMDASERGLGWTTSASDAGMNMFRTQVMLLDGERMSD